jgi:hypothetical protein
LETFVGALPEHLLEDLEPCRVIVHNEDAQPVGEDSGVGQGHDAATAAKPHSRSELRLPALAGVGVGEQEGRGGWGSFKKRLKRTEGGGGGL